MELAWSCARGSATAGKARPTNAMRDIVEEAQRSQRSQTPAPFGLGRRGAVCVVALAQRCPSIATARAPSIRPHGAPNAAHGSSTTGS